MACLRCTKRGTNSQFYTTSYRLLDCVHARRTAQNVRRPCNAVLFLIIALAIADVKRRQRATEHRWAVLRKAGKFVRKIVVNYFQQKHPFFGVTTNLEKLRNWKKVRQLMKNRGQVGNVLVLKNCLSWLSVHRLTTSHCRHLIKYDVAVALLFQTVKTEFLCNKWHSFYKNSSGDEIANVNFFTTSHM